MQVPVVSDIHDITQIDTAAEVLDILQIPALLCRQTDLVYGAAATGKCVNVKRSIHGSERYEQCIEENGRIRKSKLGCLQNADLVLVIII